MIGYFILGFIIGIISYILIDFINTSPKMIKRRLNAQKFKDKSETPSEKNILLD